MGNNQISLFSDISINLLGIHPKYGRKFIIFHSCALLIIFGISLIPIKEIYIYTSLPLIIEVFFIAITYYVLKGVTESQIKQDLEQSIKSIYNIDFTSYNLFLFKDLISKKFVALYVCPINNEIYIKDSTNNNRIVLQEEFYKTDVLTISTPTSKPNIFKNRYLFKIFLMNKGIIEFELEDNSFASNMMACIEQYLAKKITPQIIHNNGIIHNGSGDIKYNKLNN